MFSPLVVGNFQVSADDDLVCSLLPTKLLYLVLKVGRNVNFDSVGQ